MSIFSQISMVSSTSMPRYQTVLWIFECQARAGRFRRLGTPVVTLLQANLGTPICHPAGWFMEGLKNAEKRRPVAAWRRRFGKDYHQSWIRRSWPDRPDGE